MDVLYCAHKQQNEDRLYLRWCTSFSDVSFDEYKQKAGWDKIFNTRRQFTNDNSHEKEETEEEILAKVAEILR